MRVPARDQKYMWSMLTKIFHMWRKAPDLRLGQLLAAALQRSGRDTDIFFVSDSDILEFIEKLVGDNAGTS